MHACLRLPYVQMQIIFFSHTIASMANHNEGKTLPAYLLSFSAEYIPFESPANTCSIIQSTLVYLFQYIFPSFQVGFHSFRTSVMLILSSCCRFSVGILPRSSLPVTSILYFSYLGLTIDHNCLTLVDKWSQSLVKFDAVTQTEIN